MPTRTTSIPPSLRPVAADPRPDAVLLDRFRTHKDDAAFAALVVRHAPAVRAVCRGWLRQPADLDDAAQATFLVLVRRADTIRDGAALPKWLYRTAKQVARRLKVRAKPGVPLTGDEPMREVEANDDAEAVAAEVARLPEKYRLPVQLCYAAGLTTAEAAERLGCPRGTVLTRLARGRALVRRRLAARGITAGVLAITGGRAASARWVWVTVRAALGESDALSDRVGSVTEGVVRAMTLNKLRMWAAAGLVATAVIGFVAGQWASADGPTRKVDSVVVKDVPVKPDENVPPVPGKRKEAVIRLPVGTYVKEFEVAPYGGGKLTWTYHEDERVSGKIEVNVDMFGCNGEIVTESEIALSSSGTAYGIITGVKLTQLKINPALLGGDNGNQLAGMKIGPEIYPLIEPFVNEVFTDLPFSYQFRVSGDRLTIHNYRILLSGPYGKVGALIGAAGDGEGVKMFMVVQGLAAAIEGSYTKVPEGEKEAPRKPLSKPASKR